MRQELFNVVQRILDFRDEKGVEHVHHAQCPAECSSAVFCDNQNSLRRVSSVLAGPATFVCVCGGTPKSVVYAVSFANTTGRHVFDFVRVALLKPKYTRHSM